MREAARIVRSIPARAAVSRTWRTDPGSGQPAARGAATVSAPVSSGRRAHAPGRCCAVPDRSGDSRSPAGASRPFPRSTALPSAVPFVVPAPGYAARTRAGGPGALEGQRGFRGCGQAPPPACNPGAPRPRHAAPQACGDRHARAGLRVQALGSGVRPKLTATREADCRCSTPASSRRATPRLSPGARSA